MVLQKKSFRKGCLLFGILMLLAAVAFAKEKAPIFYTGRDYRDPTLNPLLSRAAPASKIEEMVRLPSLNLQGVVWGGDSPRAIINEQVVAKGDILSGGVEILDISKEGIKVIYRGKIFTILPGGDIEEK